MATTACSGKTTTLKPPVKIPFLVERAGSRVQIEITISEYRDYWFNLQFPYKTDDNADFLRIRQLTGSFEKDRDGKLVSSGVPLQIRLSIVGQNSAHEEVQYEKTSEPFLASYGGGYVTKRIDEVLLKPGRYVVSAESLLDAQEFNGGHAEFSVTWHPKSSVISK